MTLRNNLKAFYLLHLDIFLFFVHDYAYIQAVTLEINSKTELSYPTKFERRHNQGYKNILPLP